MQIVFFTFAGGAVGFYYQDKLLQQHKRTLVETLPALEQTLAERQRHRGELERQLEEAQQLDARLRQHTSPVVDPA